MAALAVLVAFGIPAVARHSTPAHVGIHMNSCNRAYAVAALLLSAVMGLEGIGNAQRETPRPTFEAATIKLSAGPSAANIVNQPSPNRLSIPGMTFTALVYAAYGEGGFNTSMRVTGAPDWAGKTVYAVEAVAAGPATSQQKRLMLQSLLEERFALRLHDASDTDAALGDILTLVVDKPDGTLGPKVKPWGGTCPSEVPPLVMQAPRRLPQQVGDRLVAGPPSDDDDPNVPYCPSGFRPGGLTINGATMATVAEMLSLPPGRSVLGTITQDRTGLTGRYSLELDYLFGVPPQELAPSLPSVVRDQWGLRLVPGKGRLKLLIIDSAQPPTPN